MANRRSFLQSAAALTAGLFAANQAMAEPTRNLNPTDQVAARGGYLGVSSGSLSKIDARAGVVRTTPVITPDVGDLPYELDGEIRVFRLTAHVFKRQIAPDKTIDAWGFNGSAPGPTIQVTQGDTVRVIIQE